MSAPRRSRQGRGLGESPTHLIPDRRRTQPAAIPRYGARDDVSAICRVRHPFLIFCEGRSGSPLQGGFGSSHHDGARHRAGSCFGERS